MIGSDIARSVGGVAGATTTQLVSDRDRPQALGRADRLQPVVLLGSVGGGLAIGAAAPEVGDAMSWGVSVGVFVLIALVMLGVSPRGVAAAFTQRRFLAAAVGINFVINPILAGGLGAIFLGDQPDLRVGLVLFLVTPCIGWYLVFTELAGGDTDLGVGLLGVNVVLQIALLPIYLAVFAGGASTIGFETIVRSVMLYLVAPAAVAAVMRRSMSGLERTPHESGPQGSGPQGSRSRVDESESGPQGSRSRVDESRGLRRVPTLKTAALVMVIVSMFASQADEIVDEIDVVGRLVAPLMIFFGVAFVVADLVARRLGLGYRQKVLLVFTTTSRNSEASLAIAATAFASPLVGLTVALGPVIELPLLIVMVRVLRRRSASVPSPPVS